MLNFELYNPTNYIFGKGQTEKLATLIPQGAKILLAYGGGSIFKNGVYDQVKSALAGFEIVEFGGIEPNPRFETLMKAVEIIREQNLTFILAVGGGSVIDGVKFISGAVHYDGNPIEILKNRVLFTDLSKVTIEATQEKLVLGGSALFPKFSICDPTVIASLPQRQIQNGVVDAFTHVMEQYLTYPHDALLQDRFAESILQTLIEIGPKVAENPTDYKLASNFMWCATMALNGLIQKGVPSDWATHMIGHELTALYEIDHARTLAIIGPNLYRALFDTKKEKLAQYGERVWNVTGNSIDEKANQAIEKTVDFFHVMGMKTKLSENTESYQNTADFIVNRFDERGWKALGEKQNVTLEKVREIVEMSY
jgi:NADP-dependent alcohol dehydrogenase